MHASVVLDHGIDLMFGINPLVPFNAGRVADDDKLSRGGLPVVLSQTFRTLLQSRMQVGLGKYAQQYPGTDQLVFEPNEDDGEMFHTNIFSYSSRQHVCAHAFASTLADLRRRREVLAPLFARHGLRLRDEVLDDPKIGVASGLGPRRRRTEATARLDRALDQIERAAGTPKSRAKRRAR